MTSIDPARALTVYQERVGRLTNEILMRDIAIADLEERVRDLELQLKSPKVAADPA